jgi:hypothetical protein
VRRHDEGQLAADDRPAALELVDRDVYAGSGEGLERLLEAVLTEEAREVAVLAPGPAEERPVGTRGGLEDRGPHHAEEVHLAPVEALGEEAVGLRERERPAEECGEPGQEPEPRLEILPDYPTRRSRRDRARVQTAEATQPRR